MVEAKTVQKQIRPITVRCGVAGCTAQSDAISADEGDDEPQIIAPRGWKFGAKHPQSTASVVVGTCPAHATK